MRIFIESSPLYVIAVGLFSPRSVTFLSQKAKDFHCEVNAFCK